MKARSIRIEPAGYRGSRAHAVEPSRLGRSGLDKALFQQFTAGKWIAEHRNLLVTGRAESTSRGCPVGHESIRSA